MKLYLMRHGEASIYENPEGERALTQKGTDDVITIGKWMAESKKVKISVIYHSPKLRARQTAELIAQMIHPSEGCFEAEGLLPEHDPFEWRRGIEKMRSDTLLAGHMPFMGRLASTLLSVNASSDHYHFQTAQILCLAKERTGLWKAQWFVTPETAKSDFI